MQLKIAQEKAASEQKKRLDAKLIGSEVQSIFIIPSKYEDFCCETGYDDTPKGYKNTNTKRKLIIAH